MLAQRTTSEELNTNVSVFKDTGVEFGYGYMWWLWENVKDKRFEGGYSALGAWGQTISIFPAINAVVVYKTKPVYRRRNSNIIRMSLLKKAVQAYEGE